MDPETRDPVDEALGAMPAWMPPTGFAQRVAVRGAAILEGPPVPPRWSWPAVQAVTVGALAGIGACAAAYLLEFLMTSAPTAGSPVAAMWIWVAVAYGVAGLAVRSTISP
jgi:hypothetical protein